MVEKELGIWSSNSDTTCYYQHLGHIYFMRHLDKLTLEVVLNFNILWFYNSNYYHVVGKKGILIKQPTKLKDICRLSPKKSGIKEGIFSIESSKD